MSENEKSLTDILGYPLIEGATVIMAVGQNAYLQTGKIVGYKDGYLKIKSKSGRDMGRHPDRVVVLLNPEFYK